jgi:hypothetical protein
VSRFLPRRTGPEFINARSTPPARDQDVIRRSLNGNGRTGTDGVLKGVA